jgi:hypothetical protein
MMRLDEVVEAFESGVAVFVCGGGYVDQYDDVDDIRDDYEGIGFYSVVEEDGEILVTLFDCD